MILNEQEIKAILELKAVMEKHDIFIEAGFYDGCCQLHVGSKILCGIKDNFNDTYEIEPKLLDQILKGANNE